MFIKSGCWRFGTSVLRSLPPLIFFLVVGDGGVGVALPFHSSLWWWLVLFAAQVEIDWSLKLPAFHASPTPSQMCAL